MATTRELQFQFGPYVPIIRTDSKIIIDQQGAVEEYYKSPQSPYQKRLLGEIFPDDYIVEAPSLVTPFLLKKKTIWPPRVRVPSPNTGGADQQENANGEFSGNDDNVVGESDIQVVEVVNKSPAEVSRYRNPEEYIKATIIANLTNNARKSNTDPIIAIKDYSKSSASDLLTSIGLNRVHEFICQEKARNISKKMQKGLPGLIPEFEAAKTKLAETRKFNVPYLLQQSLRCPHCPFKTPFKLVLDAHLEVPHRYQTRYLCNWCSYKTKDSSQILYHNYAVHRNTRCRIEKPLSVHCCRYCSFESNSKRKFSSHVISCERLFQEDLNQAPDTPLDHPALTSKLITQNDIRVYETTLKSLRLAAYNPHQIKVTSPANGFINQPILLLPSNSLRSIQSKPRPQSISLGTFAVANFTDFPSCIGEGNSGADKSSASASDKQESSHLLRLLSSQTNTNNLPQNNTSMLQFPRPQSVFVNGIAAGKNVRSIVMAPPNQTPPPRAQGVASEPIEIDLTEEDNEPVNDNPNGTFLICEICDSYIGDLEMFKSHMNMVHKVKIHHKLQETTRPPLNCQRCDWRFFTDQGLERHLLGAHSLVTSNMQELAERNKDSGRCPVCGERCASQLLAHMKDNHKMTLRAAQLSYKCTVCSATFSLYRNFENHVYWIHADAIRANK